MGKYFIEENVKLASDKSSKIRIFESPVVRLIKEENYIDLFNKFVEKNRKVTVSTNQIKKPQSYFS